MSIEHTRTDFYLITILAKVYPDEYIERVFLKTEKTDNCFGQKNHHYIIVCRKK